MGTGYTRNDTSNNITDGNIINAADLDGEFDAIVSAFSTSGHTHDGTAAEGGAITVVGPVQDLVVSATQVKPKTTNTLDLGTSLLQFKDLYIDGSAYIDGLGEDITVATDKKIQFRDTGLFINSSVNGQLDIDADVEVEIATPTLDINATATDISGTLTVGGTITATSGGSLTGTWSSLGSVTTIDINGGTIDGAAINNTVIGATTAVAGTFTTLTGTAITASTSVATPSLNINSSTAVNGILDEDTMSSNSATKLATQQSIKAYVDSRVATIDTLAEILAIGNTTGSNNIVVSSGQAITTNTINETTADSGVTIDSVLLKNGGVTTSGSGVFTGNLTGNVTGNLTGNVTSTGTSTFTTVDINGGAIDGTSINNSSIGATAQSTGAFTTLSASGAATLNGTATFNNDVTFDGVTAGRDVTWDRSENNMIWADNAQAQFGTGLDLKLYHDSATGNSYITEAGTGNLKISASQIDFLGGADGAETMATMVDNGAVTLYYDNTARIATSTSGVSITGTAAVTGNITVSGTVDGRDIATDGTKLDTIATNANYITNNNQLTNGAGYVTSSGVTSITAGTGLSGGTITSSGTISMSGSYSGTFTATNLNFTGNLQEDGTSLTPSYSTAKAYTRLPGGLILQWGYHTTNGGTQTVSYPLTFPTEVLSVTITPTRSGSGVTMDAPYVNSGAIGSGSTSSFTFYWSNEGNGMSWQAIGR